MKIKKNLTYIPTYLQIEDQLIDFFKHKNMTKGDKLPTEDQLTKLFKVSRTTIRKTLYNLQEKGFLNRIPGKGTFYAGGPLHKFAEASNKKIGLVNYYFMDYIYTEILKGIEDEARDSGYSLINTNNTRLTEKQNETIESLIKQEIKGIIMEPVNDHQLQDFLPILHKLHDAGIPVVTTHRPIKHPLISTVTIDDVYAGEMAAKYLLNKGHKKIGYIYNQNTEPSKKRFHGFCKILKEAGIPLNEKFNAVIEPSANNANSLQGYILTKKMLKDKKNRPSAIFYFNDNLAIQGYKAVAELGYNIPDDISILGFDNHKNAAVVTPPLTTFIHPKYDLGRWTAKILIDEIENGLSKEPMKLLFEPQLIERGSVASLL